MLSIRGIIQINSTLKEYTTQNKQYEIITNSLREQLKFKNQIITQKENIISDKDSEITILSKTVDELSTIIEEEHSNIQIAYLGKFTLTYYSKEQFPSATYTGVMPQAGITVAVDPNLIPLGSQLYINGLGVRYAQDTGGKIKGNNIDVFVDTTAEAIKLGRKQQIDVWILKS